MNEQTGSNESAGSREPKPTVGRIVHYTPLGGLGSKKQPYPAIITHVWGDECVNLNVMNDGSYTLGAQECPTSVMKGDGPRTWSWPPRV